MRGLPAERSHLARVEGVASVVPRPIRHGSDQALRLAEEVAALEAEYGLEGLRGSSSRAAPLAMLPYTSSVPMAMKRRIFRSRAASSRVKVPLALVLRNSSAPAFEQIG